MTHYHVGYPITARQIVDRVVQGLPVYLPKDPKVIDQRPYIEFASKRGPNSE